MHCHCAFVLILNNRKIVGAVSFWLCKEIASKICSSYGISHETERKTQETKVYKKENRQIRKIEIKAIAAAANNNKNVQCTCIVYLVLQPTIKKCNEMRNNTTLVKYKRSRKSIQILRYKK